MNDNHTDGRSDDVVLPPIVNVNNGSNSRSSTRNSVAALPVRIHRSRAGVDSPSESHRSSHRKSSLMLHGQIGRCAHCPHCRQMDHSSRVSTPKPKWLTVSPGTNQFQIVMDEYDVEAVKRKIIYENGHLPGSYDYRPHLTIEETADHDDKKEVYYTQPVVAQTKPRILPNRTPFPDYELLQRREQRLNKPYTLPLFE